MDLHPSPIIKTEVSALRNSVNVPLSSVVLLLVVIALGYWYFIRPEITSLQAAQGVLEQQKTIQASVNQDVANLQDLVTQIQDHSKDISRLDEALPLQNYSTRMELLMDSIAQASQVTIASMNIGSSGKGVIAGDKNLLKDPFAVQRKLSTVSIQISVTGSYEQLKAFLEKLENNSRVINTTSLALTTGKLNDFSMNLNLETYYFGVQ